MNKGSAAALPFFVARNVIEAPFQPGSIGGIKPPPFAPGDGNDHLIDQHPSDRTGRVHRAENVSPAGNEELHGLVVMTVVVIPVPGIKPGHLLVRHAIRDRHREAGFFGHFDGRFLVLHRCRDYRRSQGVKLVLLRFVTGQLPATVRSPVPAIEKERQIPAGHLIGQSDGPAIDEVKRDPWEFVALNEFTRH